MFLAGAWLARREGVTAREARWFAMFNGLPRAGFVPVWTVMQAGSLGGALAASAAAGATIGPSAGRRMAAAGGLAWIGAKAVKPFVRRGRPAAVVAAPRLLGRPQSGLGYPSGHAAVAAAVAAVAARHLPRRWRPPVLAAGLVPGAARMYVGAHLPLDVAGGVALGLAVAGLLKAAAPDAGPPGGRR